MSRKVISILLCFLFLVLVHAQQPSGYFYLTGNVKVEQGLVEGTNIQVLRNGALLRNVQVNRTGNFRIQLELGQQYLFTFSKDGYYSKSIEVDSRLPEGVCSGDCSFPPYQVAVILYRNVPGVSMSDDNIPRISYNSQIDNFDADLLRDARTMQSEVSHILDEIRKKSERYERETLKAKTDEFNKNMRDADYHSTQRNYELAMHLYRDALMIFPDRENPRRQVGRMYQLLLHEQLIETLGPANDSNLSKYINYGDQKMNEREYTVAKVAFEIANRIKPGENQIVSRLENATREVDNSYALGINEVEHYKLVYRAREKRYQELVAKGDEKFLNEELAAAKEHYALAVPQINESSYALLMVEEIDRLLHDDDIALALARQREEAERLKLQEARNRAYDDAIAEADRNFDNRLYRDAIEYYELALSIKDYELYPRNQIRIINSILARLQIEGEEYNSLIREADGLMVARKYSEARPLYVRASELIPNEQYAKGKIEEIDRLLAGADRDEAVIEKFNEIIAEADVLYENKQYDQSIAKYHDALLIIPGEKYPTEQITKIRGILSREANEQKRLEQIQSDYTQTLARADRAFNQQSYHPARLLYLQSLQLIPGQEYPQNQIARIDEILSAQQTQEPETQSELDKIDFSDLRSLSAEARRLAYSEAMQLGEQFIVSQDWGLARFYFRRALALVPNDALATEKLSFVEQQILGDNVNEARYAEMILRADEAFATGDFGVARFYYMKAGEAKPNDEYVTERILVSTRLAQSTASRTANREYDEAMQRANEAFDANNLSVARFFYRRALSLKPNDEEAKTKLGEVEELIRQ